MNGSFLRSLRLAFFAVFHYAVKIVSYYDFIISFMLINKLVLFLARFSDNLAPFLAHFFL